METATSTILSDDEREEALARYRILHPYLTDQATLKEVASALNVTERTAWRWVARYREAGLAGLVRKRRADQGQPHIHPQLIKLVEGLVLQRAKPNIAAIHRKVSQIAEQQEWDIPSYQAVYRIDRKSVV